MAKGHTIYELSEPWHDELDAYSVRGIPAMLGVERQEFEGIGGEARRVWPERGSRAFLRVLGKSVPPAQVGAWLIVQPGHYRYAVDWQIESVGISPIGSCGVGPMGRQARGGVWKKPR